MSVDDLFERRMRNDLRDLLEAEPLPHPWWAQSPAAERAERGHERRRWPLRLLAIAALLLIGSAATVGAAWLLRPLPPTPAPASNGWVAFTDWNGSTYDVLFVRPGVPPTRVIGSDGDSVWETCSAFSPDGTKLAYVEAADDSSDTPDWTLAIARLDANGLPVGTPARLYFRESASCPIWSPDGRHMAFSATSGLHVVDLDTRQTVLVAGHGRTDATARPDDYGISDFKWAPDGRSLAYVKTTPQGAGGNEPPFNELWSTSLAGDQMLLLALASNEDIATDAFESIAWAPDGSSIAIGGSVPLRLPDGGLRPGTHFVGLVEGVGAGTYEELDSWPASDGGLNSGPTFGPDGTLAYVREGEVVIDDLTGHPRSLAIEGVGRPATPACIAGWSAAGDRILVVVLDQPFQDRGVNMSLVEVSLDGQSDPVVLQPWGSTSVHSCGASWQELPSEP